MTINKTQGIIKVWEFFFSINFFLCEGLRELLPIENLTSSFQAVLPSFVLSLLFRFVWTLLPSFAFVLSFALGRKDTYKRCFDVQVSVWYSVQ